MKRTSLLAALVCLSFSASLARDDYRRSTAIDILHYRISVEIGETSDEIKAQAEITLAMNEDGVREVALDLSGMVVGNVLEQRAGPARFSLSQSKLLITLQGNYKRGDNCILTISYHGRPTDGLYIKKNKFGDRTVFADNWPNRAHHWFPSIDHPYDKAGVDFLVTAPAGYEVIANGALIERITLEDGRKLTHWRERVPIPVYCMVIGATQFSIRQVGSWNGIELSYYLYPKDYQKGIKDFGRALQMIEFYTNLIGPYPYEKLALVESSTRFGGMENSSNIFFDEKAFNGSGKLEGTVAHEIAHQWFGDSVTESDWHHLWLSEGFATYFGHLFFERADGRESFLKMMLDDKEKYLKAYGSNPPPIHDTGVTNPSQLLNANNYQKGAWVLHMLRHLMGDQKFFSGIRDYYLAHRDRNALTVDFQRVMESHAGRGLDWFFKQWIFGPGYPIYDATWAWDEGAKRLLLRVKQKQEKTLFAMPLDVEIRVGDSALKEVIEVKDREQLFTFTLAAKPVGVSIDPEEWVLKVLTLTESK